jgi:hypothetical protein
METVVVTPRVFGDAEVRLLMKDIAQEMSKSAVPPDAQRAFASLRDRESRKQTIVQNGINLAMASIEARKTALGTNLNAAKDAFAASKNAHEQANAGKFFKTSAPAGFAQAQGVIDALSQEFLAEQNRARAQQNFVVKMGANNARAMTARQALVASPWKTEEIRFLQTQAQFAFNQAPQVLETAAMLDAWNRYFAKMFEAAVRAVDNMDKTLKQYVDDTNKRRALYVKVFTTLVGAALSVVGLGAIADTLGQALTAAVSLNPEILQPLADRAAQSFADSVKEADIADKVTEGLVNAVEGKFHNPGLEEMRKSIKDVGKVMDTADWMKKLTIAIENDLKKLVLEVAEALKKFEFTEAHPAALLRVMSERSGLDTLLRGQTSADEVTKARALIAALPQQRRDSIRLTYGAGSAAANAAEVAGLRGIVERAELHEIKIKAVRDQVWADCLSFYKCFSSVMYADIITRYKSPEIVSTDVLSRLDETMEKWAWAVLVKTSGPLELNDMTRASPFGAESAVVKRLSDLHIFYFRADTSEQTPELKKQTVAEGKAGTKFGVGKFGETSQLALKGWSEQFLMRTPIDHALNR